MGQEEMASNCTRRGSCWILGNFFRARLSSPGTAAQSTSLGRIVFKSLEGFKALCMWHLGTRGGLGCTGEWLDLMSSTNYSMDSVIVRNAVINDLNF